MLTIELQINGEIIRRIRIVNKGKSSDILGELPDDRRVYEIDNNPALHVEHNRSNGALELARLALEKLKGEPK